VKKTKDTGSAVSGINITPIIDVTLVLVIVMLVTAPVIDIPNINVSLPEAVSTESKEKNVTISLGKDGRVAVGEEIVPWDSVPAKINSRLRQDKNMVVIIRADKDVEYVSVESLIEMVKTKSAAKRIAVATKQKMQRIAQ
jgi:biopolymer transport protein ExbD